MTPAMAAVSCPTTSVDVAVPWLDNTARAINREANLGGKHLQ